MKLRCRLYGHIAGGGDVYYSERKVRFVCARCGAESWELLRDDEWGCTYSHPKGWKFL